MYMYVVLDNELLILSYLAKYALNQSVITDSVCSLYHAKWLFPVHRNSVPIQRPASPCSLANVCWNNYNCTSFLC